MNIRIKFFSILRCVLAGFLLLGATSAVLAAQSSNESELAQKLQEISQQAEQLQQQMTALKAELDQLKQAKKSEERKIVQAKAPKKLAAVETTVEPQDETDDVASPQFRIPTTVTTSPYIGLRSAFDASDLLTNVPTMNEDLRLLRQRNELKKKLAGRLPYLDRPIIVLSGKLEAFTYNRSTYTSETESDIDLNTMELDFLVNASNWAFGFISVDYDNSFLDTSLSSEISGSRIANSRIFLKRGFITLGDLERFPIYLSAGQMYLNFGRYGSSLVTPPLTLLLGQTNERQIQVGYAGKNGFDLSLYAFKGETHVGSSPKKVNDGGVNLGYNKELTNDFSLGFGAGLISNIANADAIQITNLPYPRQGFASISQAINSPNERIAHRVPAMDLHVEFALGPWTFMAEYVGTTRPFSADNFNYNGRGASPKAVHTELNRKFLFFDKPANASVVYDQSWQALAIGLPTHKYAAVFNVSPIKNTILSIEFSHFKNYPWGTTAYVKGLELPLILPYAPYISPGGSGNMILAQLGLYF